MGKIKVLPEEIIARIAAGEVIERPCSVIKELLENSIDAGSTMISISIRNGGKSLIKVVDNGEGMDQVDAQNCLLRYATSKIDSFEDLQRIKSLGFRGEALPSIAAVSRFAIITRNAANGIGTEIRGEGGKIEEIRYMERPVGTTVEIRDLFFNLPVRRKFLKSERIEYAEIIDIINRLAISYPEISFRLYRDNSLVLDYHPSSNIESRIRQVFPQELGSQLIPILITNSDWRITGFIGKPEVNRGNRSSQYFFVNLRPVKILSFSFALQHSFEGLVPPGRHPVAFIFLEIDPSRVDVNIHPHKREVRILNEGIIQAELTNRIKETLRKELALIELKLDKPHLEKGVKEDQIQFQRTQGLFKEGNDRFPFRNLPVYPEASKKMVSNVPDNEVDSFRNSNGDIKEVSTFNNLRIERIYGQFKGTYILVEVEDGLMIIDQHAAHERIVYEEVLSSLKNGSSHSQTLLIPLVIHLDGKEFALFEEYLPLLEKIGFGINVFGKNSFSVDACPLFLKPEEIPETIMNLVQNFYEGNSQSSHDNKYNKVARIIACKSRSIKAHQDLNLEEILELIKRLEKTEQPFFCPHGRPTVIKLTTRELETKFLR